MEKTPYPKLQKLLCAAGILVLAQLFILWAGKSGGLGLFELLAALAAIGLLLALCLRFVPGCFAFCFGASEDPRPAKSAFSPLSLFCAGLLWALVNYLLIGCVLHYVNQNLTLRQYIDFWQSADAYHYVCIARDWYLSEGALDRLVQLVFLPGFPLVLRLFHYLTGEYLVAGMLCSSLCFSAALCVIYQLALLDFDTPAALRAVVFAALMPGAFFFFAPMSESLFLLLCALCVYCARRRKWVLAGMLGACAAFTRSLGLMLFVPVFFEWLRAFLQGRERLRRCAALLLIPLGFAAYCGVNYTVAGNPFQFMIYQREHWSQSLGLFFNTAAYQTRYALSSAAKGDARQLVGLWLPNLIALFTAPTLLFLAARRLRPSYTAWAIAYYIVAVGATWLLSAPRYMAVLLPLPLALALLSDKKAAKIVLYTLLGCGNLAYLILFALRWNVW